MDFDKIQRQLWSFTDFEGWTPEPNPSVRNQLVETVLASDFDALYLAYKETRRALYYVQLELAKHGHGDFPEARTELAQEVKGK